MMVFLESQIRRKPNYPWPILSISCTLGLTMAERSGDVVFRVDQSDNDSDLWDDSALIKAYDKAISYVKGMTNDGSEKEGKNKPKRKRGGKKKNKKNSTPVQSKWKVGDRCKSVFTEDDQVYSAVVTSVNNKKASCIVRYTGYGNEEEKRLSDLFTESEAEHSINSKAELENGYDSMEWTDHSQSPMHPTTGGGPRKRSHFPAPPHAPHIPPPHPGIAHPLGYTSPYAGASWYPPHRAPPPPMPPPPPMMSPLPFAPWGSPAPQLMPSWGGASPHHATQTPQGIPSMPPTPPPHPPLPEDVEDMDKDALHSMLMSWYMSGYHTGYYEGLKKSKSKPSSHSSTSKPKEDSTTPRREQDRDTRTREKAKDTEELATSQLPEESQDTKQET